MLIAFFGAVAATIGDLLMLWVGNAQRPELGLGQPPELMLWIGCLLGVIGLPAYGLGYLQLQNRFKPDDSMLVRALGSAGFGAGLVGACVHGYTALLIKQGLDASVTQTVAPADAVLASGPLLLILWSITFLCLLVAVTAWVVLQIKSGRGRQLVTIANPLVITIGLVVIGGMGPLLESFLLPAAPNLAHALFFGLLLRGPISAASDVAVSEA